MGEDRYADRQPMPSSWDASAAGLPFTEVIGGACGLSPYTILIEHWLAELGTAGEVRETAIECNELAVFLAERQADPRWRGCIAAAPQRQRLVAMVSIADPQSRMIGAVQCVVPEAGALLGVNLDIAGIEEALDRVLLEGARAAVLGTGSVAKAAIAYLGTRSLDEILVVARSQAGADTLSDLAPGTYVEVMPPERASDALAAARLIVSTSPLGVSGAALMQRGLLDAITLDASDKILFDANPTAEETALLRIGRAHGARVIDGMTMLMGQARLAFELFFGDPAPPADLVARNLLQQALFRT